MARQELNHVLAFLEETPEIVRQLGKGFSPADLSRKPAGGAFSFLEQVCHLRDIEREGYGYRIRKMLDENQPTLPDIDGDQLARERDYNNQDFEAALSDFTRARRENMSLVKQSSAEQLNRGAVLETVGAITINSLLMLMCDHDEAHRKELSELSVKAGA
jgi:hypothetical protein